MAVGPEDGEPTRMPLHLRPGRDTPFGGPARLYRVRERGLAVGFSLQAAPTQSRAVARLARPGSQPLRKEGPAVI